MAILLVLGFAVNARADGFGSAGVIAPSGSISLSYSRVSPPSGSSSSDTTSTGIFTIAPGAMFFVTDGFAVGGQVVLGYTTAEDSNETDYGLAPAVGFNIPMGDSVSLFPTAGVAALMGNAKQNSGSTIYKGSFTMVNLQVNAPLLIHFSNFYIGAGPEFSMQLVSKFTPDGGDSIDGSKSMVVGVSTVMGGWI